MAMNNYIGINIMMFLVLVIMYKYINSNEEKNIFEQNLFLGLIISNTIMLFLQIFYWVINYNIGIVASVFNNSIATLYIVIAPIPCMLWSVYVHYQIYKDTKKIKKIYNILILPTILNFIVSISNIYTGAIFKLTENNSFIKGNLYILVVINCLAYILYALFLAIKNMNKLEKNTFVSILTFIIPPLVGGIFQVVFKVSSIIWICMTISLLYTYISNQNKELYTDYLTGLYNRRKLDYYLKQQIRNVEKDKFVAGIMIDINSFKEINDYYGHSIGDEALIDTAQILKKSVRKNDLVARYGGDEFVIILTVRNQATLNKTVDRIYENIDEHNKKKITPYRLSLSIGYDIFDKKSVMPMQQFFNHIDNLMYREKNKLSKRRATV